MVNSASTPHAADDDRWIPLDAVIRDSGAAVIVLDAALRIHAINDVACELANIAPAGIVGRCLSSVLPTAVFEERRRLIASLLPGDAPVRAVEVLFGCITVSTYRCFVTEVDNPESRVLIILRPVRSSDEYQQLRARPDIRRLQQNHLGPLARLTVREI